MVRNVKMVFVTLDTDFNKKCSKQPYETVLNSGVSIRRKDRLWDRLGTPER